MDLDFTYMPEEVVFSPFCALCLLSLLPTDAWTLVGRRGTWEPISLLPPFSDSSFPTSVTVQPRCEEETQAQVDPLAHIVSVIEPPVVKW